MSKYRTAFAGLLLLGLLSSSLAHANTSEEKRMRGRLGVGFTNQIATTTLGNIPALSAKYYISREFSASLGVGFDTRANNSAVALGGKVFRNVFYESNLIFFLGGGLAFVSNKGSTFQGSLFLGSEFFLPQVPSLGLSFEAGLRGDNTSGAFAIRTMGDSFLSAGMHFYF